MIHLKQKFSIFLLLIMFLSLFVNSCKKEKDSIIPTAPGVVPPNYGQLRVGNYWVYENLQDNGTGVLTSYNVFDSCFIDKDTVVQGTKYYRMRTINTNGINYVETYSEYLRDTFVNHQYVLVRLGGNLLFTDLIGEVLGIGTQTNTAGDIISNFSITIIEPDSSIIVPAGTFKTLGRQFRIEFAPNINQDDSLATTVTHYADGYGFVFEHSGLYYKNPPNYSEHWEKRLIRYHIEH